MKITPRIQRAPNFEFSYNPQDSSVMNPDVVAIDGVSIGNFLSTDKVRLKGGLHPEQGRFVYPLNDRRYYAANAFAAVNLATKIFQDAYGEPIKWATGRKQLDVTADYGKELHAYYSRWELGLVFSKDVDKITQETVYAAGSGEVVVHETGHAILDALRPGYFSTWSSEPPAFHEAFGDVLAILVTLKNDGLVDLVAEQTGGDLTRPNFAADLGEQLGTAINNNAGSNVTGGRHIRSAINSFAWQDPSTLPDRAPANQLSSEEHSFSRVWTGAFYDVLASICRSKMEEEGMSARQALASTADEGLKMLARQMRKAPDGDFTFPDMAAALLSSENELNAGRYSVFIQEAFANRNMLPEGANLVDPSEPIEPGTTALSARIESGPLAGATVSTLLSGSTRLMRDQESERHRLLSDIKRLQSQGRILMTEPNQVIRSEDLFDPHGHPYAGIVRWSDGEMTLERIPIGH